MVLLPGMRRVEPDIETVMGVDIGQKRDPTAICVAEAEDRGKQHFLVRFLERLPLGTAYPDVARRVGEIVTQIEKKTRYYPVLYVDATGVGMPIVDLLQEEAPCAHPRAVYFTHGTGASRKATRSSWGRPISSAASRRCSRPGACICRRLARPKCSPKSC